MSEARLVTGVGTASAVAATMAYSWPGRGRGRGRSRSKSRSRSRGSRWRCPSGSHARTGKQAGRRRRWSLWLWSAPCRACRSGGALCRGQRGHRERVGDRAASPPGRRVGRHGRIGRRRSLSYRRTAGNITSVSGLTMYACSEGDAGGVALRRFPFGGGCFRAEMVGLGLTWRGAVIRPHLADACARTPRARCPASPAQRERSARPTVRTPNCRSSPRCSPERASAGDEVLQCGPGEFGERVRLGRGVAVPKTEAGQPLLRSVSREGPDNSEETNAPARPRPLNTR